MPIIGLTDAKSFDIAKGLPRLGKLRKGGEKRKNKKGKEIMGVDLDYFRVDFEEQYAHLEPVFASLYGDEPQEFSDVLFFSDEPEQVFSTWFEQWGSGETLLTRCDGQNQVLHYNKDANAWSKAKIPCRGNGRGEGCDVCNRTGRLSFVLWDFVMQTGEVGYFTVETHSIHDIMRLHNALRLVKMQAGHVTGMRWVLGRAGTHVSTPMPNGRGVTEKSLLYLRVTSGDAERVFFPAHTATPQLTSGEPTADAQELRKRLGNNGSRRIGAPEPEPAESEEIVEVDPVTGELLTGGDPEPTEPTKRDLLWSWSQDHSIPFKDRAAFDEYIQNLIELDKLKPADSLDDMQRVIAADIEADAKAATEDES